MPTICLEVDLYECNNFKPEFWGENLEANLYDRSTYTLKFMEILYLPKKIILANINSKNWIALYPSTVFYIFIQN